MIYVYVVVKEIFIVLEEIYVWISVCTKFSLTLNAIFCLCCKYNFVYHNFLKLNKFLIFLKRFVFLLTFPSANLVYKS